MPPTAAQDFAAYQLCRDKTAAQLADIIRAPDTNKAVRLAAVRALQQLDYAAIRPMIADLLDSPFARQRAVAAAVLGQMQTELDASERNEIAAALLVLLHNDVRASVRAECVVSAGHLFRRGVLAQEDFACSGFASALRPLWQSPRLMLANALAFAAAYIPLDKDARQFLLRQLANADNTAASWALFAVAEQGWHGGEINEILQRRMARLHPRSRFYHEISDYLDD